MTTVKESPGSRTLPTGRAARRPDGAKALEAKEASAGRQGGLVLGHLLSVVPLLPEEVDLILDTAESFAEISARSIKKVPTLRGRTVATLFYEPSTRTRVSFELAAKRLSADVVNISSSGSSTSKGEGLKDTARTLEAMGVDCVVLRHSQSGAADLLAGWIKASVINGGDGRHEHPTQALLDLFTIRRRFGSVRGKTVAIVGDIAHSRVARSNLLLFSKMGAEVVVVGPPTLIPPGIEELGCRVAYRLDEVLGEADVLYLLRLQMERGTGLHLPSLREYASLYCLTEERLSKARGALVMHPGPINRGVEVASTVADRPQSLIEEQVEAGVAVRMAVLYLLLGQT